MTDEARVLEQQIVVDEMVTADPVETSTSEGVWHSRALDVYSDLYAIADRIHDLGVRESVLAAAHRLAGENVDTAESVSLTNRERDVLALLSSGLSNRDIADRLGVGVYTIKGHLKNLMQKLAARNRFEVVVKGRRARLIP
ncbi:response regulator transcription factor [Rhodococcus fascians]|nr:response regulator transcription factor [Rhodococcus fascians]MBY4140980.1 response regulator transcription factor [Rhodococcus fascians]MBY4219644.1 response regulator transcription factor [Rhodococcus fascians]MBY4221953.1 response regulator transcription factor [Rhodococcus fascians]MBY4233954.1 response regulator transcription factor [Rhodococcus fascians]